MKDKRGKERLPKRRERKSEQKNNKRLKPKPKNKLKLPKTCKLILWVPIFKLH